MASDLGQRLDRDFTPVGLASRMWNHAPEMWSAMRQAQIEIPQLTEEDGADLFAFFYARRFFERRGDAARGKAAFDNKCASCHAAQSAGKPVSEWTSLADSVEIAQRLWNHAPGMQKVLESKARRWPELTSIELTDLLVYVQNLPATRSNAFTFNLPTGGRGKELLEAKGCKGCHKGASGLEGRLGDRTLTDLAASMWNHAPKMREQAAVLSADEMREILAYVWGTDFLRSRSDGGRGNRVFASQCGSCHGKPSTGAPDLKAATRSYNAVTLVWALWTHGPNMLKVAEEKKMRWPTLSEEDMGQLIAFLNSQGK